MAGGKSKRGRAHLRRLRALAGRRALSTHSLARCFSCRAAAAAQSASRNEGSASTTGRRNRDDVCQRGQVTAARRGGPVEPDQGSRRTLGGTRLGPGRIDGSRAGLVVQR